MPIGLAWLVGVRRACALLARVSSLTSERPYDCDSVCHVLADSHHGVGAGVVMRMFSKERLAVRTPPLAQYGLSASPHCSTGCPM